MNRLDRIPLLFLTFFLVPASPATGFDRARPVWPAGQEREMNLTAGFRAVFSQPAGVPVRLRITGSSVYRVWLNGRFVHYGPARAAHGFYRLDEVNLTPFMRRGDNLLAVELAGYNVNSYYLLDQPSFLQAEIIAEGRVVCASG
ncbi:MAG TPA: hypothetical protein VJ417_10505, partial [Candidatus Glassbacteria bacterium]|nr:hypothetical protein [Candidatus Glassbacteria bacterium]